MPHGMRVKKKKQNGIYRYFHAENIKGMYILSPAIIDATITIIHSTLAAAVRQVEVEICENTLDLL